LNGKKGENVANAFSFGYAFNLAFLIGRILIGVFFLMAGFNHFVRLNMMAAYAKMKGVPAPAVAVGGSGILLVLGGASMLLGFHPTIGVILLVIFLLPTTFMMHNFWAIQDPQAKLTEMIMFQKNVAILGLLLMTLLIERPWPISLGR
jgi:putative oxidoreductase